MKKIIALTVVMALFTMAASAQVGFKNSVGAKRCATQRITPIERHELRKDAVKLRTAQRIAKRDGVVTPKERVTIHRLKAESRRDAFRYTHNRRNRV
ncbi:MAG: hypothetical protein RL115_299 [Bacteroidota bacterium]